MHADEVVSVHDSVDESVKDDGKVDITIIEYVSVEPVEEENGRVVVNMQKGKLSPFLSKYNENGIPEIPNLGNVEQPQKVGNCRVLLAISYTRGKGITVTVSQQTCLDCHVRTKHDLRYVVKEFDRVGVECRQKLHDLRSDNYKSNISQGNT